MRTLTGRLLNNYITEAIAGHARLPSPQPISATLDTKGALSVHFQYISNFVALSSPLYPIAAARIAVMLILFQSYQDLRFCGWASVTKKRSKSCLAGSSAPPSQI